MKRYLFFLLPLFAMGFSIYSLIRGFNEGVIYNFFSEAGKDSFSVDESPIMFWIMMAVAALFTSVSPYAAYLLWPRGKTTPKEKHSK